MKKWYDIVDDYYLKKGGLENQATNFNKDANKMIKERLNNATVTEKMERKLLLIKETCLLLNRMVVISLKRIL